MAIKNIIFDLGGVILNIDYYKTIQAFNDLGMEDASAMYTQAKQSTLFDDIEIGSISPGTFADGIRSFIEVPVTNEQVFHAWNALIEDLPEERITLLRELKNKFNTVLLSNTNEIHYDCYKAQLEKQYGTYPLAEVFQREYYSHEIKLRKPDSPSFEYVLTESKFKREETLFIDDSEQHIVAAKSIGIHAYLLTGGETILDILSADRSDAFLAQFN